MQHEMRRNRQAGYTPSRPRFAKALREICAYVGIHSVSDLSREASLPKPRVKSWWLGNRSPSREGMERLHDIFRRAWTQKYGSDPVHPQHPFLIFTDQEQREAGRASLLRNPELNDERKRYMILALELEEAWSSDAARGLGYPIKLKRMPAVAMPWKALRNRWREGRLEDSFILLEPILEGPRKAYGDTAKAEYITETFSTRVFTRSDRLANQPHCIVEQHGELFFAVQRQYSMNLRELDLIDMDSAGWLDDPVTLDSVKVLYVEAGLIGTEAEITFE